MGGVGRIIEPGSSTPAETIEQRLARVEANAQMWFDQLEDCRRRCTAAEIEVTDLRSERARMRSYLQEIKNEAECALFGAWRHRIARLARNGLT